jgi:hypothetical protein
LGQNGFVFLNVDGGVVNNNPFEYAQYALMGDATADEKTADTADRAVIMVSPFPEPPDFLPDGRPGRASGGASGAVPDADRLGAVQADGTRSGHGPVRP